MTDDIEKSFQEFLSWGGVPEAFVNKARGAHSAGWWDGQESLRRERDGLLRIADEFSTSLLAGPSATIDFAKLAKADDEFMELLESRKALKGETE